jgi:hypothetical protein
MKKSIFTLIAACIAVFFQTHAYAQTNNVTPFTDSKIFLKSIQTIASLDLPVDFSGSSATDVKAVNVKAIKDFKSRYGRTLNEKWFTIPGGFESYFQEEGFGDRAFYDKKGNWLSSLKMYGENQLPKDVRKQVKSTYFDYSITLVEEIQIPDHLVYIVHLEDNKSIKIVRVNTDGDMDVMQDLDKQ